MNDSNLYIPHTANRFSISSDGVVFDLTSNTQLHVEHLDGRPMVKFGWIFGDKYYDVALLALVSHSRLGIPEHKLEEVEPMSADGDPNNLSIDNIVYRFRNGPIETEHFSEYFHVPFYPLYAINKSGSMINIENGKEKTWNIMHASEDNGRIKGYRYTKVYRDDGRMVTIFRHRVLGLAFLEYDHRVKKLEINHRDGFPGNDVLPNLEWNTHKENIEHAYEIGLNNNNKPVIVYNFFTKIEKVCRSVGAAATYVGEQSENPDRNRRGMINNRLRQEEFVLYNDGWLFKYVDDKRPWPVVTKDTKLLRVGRFNKVFAKNVFTGEVFVLRDAEQASEYTEVNKETIKEHARNKSNIPYQGWLFRYPDATGTPEWPEFSKHQLEIFKKHPVYPQTGVLAVSIHSSEEILFTTVKEAVAYFKTTQFRLWNYIKSKKPIDGLYRLEYVLTNGKVTPKK